MTTDQAARQVHTGNESCPVRPLHDPCHTGCGEDGWGLGDMTAASMWIAWRRQIRGTPAVPDDPYHPPGSCDACARPPDLESGSSYRDVPSILAAIRVVDAHLDDSAPEIYRSNPLANMWRRAYGPVSEAAETQDALTGFTGGNPRKGVTHTKEDMLGEAADTAVSALLFIQSQTKNTGETWLTFIAALDKGLSRVPGASPFPPEPGMAGQDAIDNGIPG